MKFYHLLLVSLAMTVTVQAKASPQCEADQLMSMGCSSFVSGPGIGTNIFLLTTEFQQCRHGVLKLEDRITTTIIDSEQATDEDTKLSLEPKMSSFEHLDYDPRVRVHFLTGATIKLNGDTFKVSVTKNRIKSDPNSLESYYDGLFMKTNSKGKVVETGKLICTVNF